jgi:hypothetical protein
MMSPIDLIVGHPIIVSFFGGCVSIRTASATLRAPMGAVSR